MNHSKEYPLSYLADILNDVQTIAMVGASSDPTKFSYGVLRVLHETGYTMIPINPTEVADEIRGLKCYGSLSEVPCPVDMVQIFRTSDAAYGVTKEAISIGAKVVWMARATRRVLSAVAANQSDGTSRIFVAWNLGTINA